MTVALREFIDGLDGKRLVRVHGDHIFAWDGNHQVALWRIEVDRARFLRVRSAGSYHRSSAILEEVEDRIAEWLIDLDWPHRRRGKTA